MANPSIYLPQRLLDRVEAHIAANPGRYVAGTGRSTVVQAALREYLANHERHEEPETKDRQAILRVETVIDELHLLRTQLARQASARDCGRRN